MTLRNYSSTAAETTLSAGVDASTTTLTVSATTGFPATPFVLAIDAGAAAQELVLVTNVAGTTLTVTRAYDSTVGAAHSTGAVVSHSHAAIDFREANTHVNAESGVHGATGDVVGTTDTQTLTNKTLALGSNTVSGTKAQFNAALTDGDFATLAGTESLTNKDLSSATNTLPSNVPGGVLGYAQVTANQAGITAAADLTGLSVTVTVAAGRRIRITSDTYFTHSLSAGNIFTYINEGGTQLTQRDKVQPTAGVGAPHHLEVVLTPSAGEHTYKLRASTPSGTAELQAAATYPSFILVEDIGV